MRGLPAGYDLDRLPLAVPPVAGELAVGWLSRVSQRYGLTPRGLLAAIGTPTPSYSLRAVARHLHRHTGQVTALLGSPPPGRWPSELGLLDGALADYQHTYAGSVGRWPSGSRFCPPCLTGASDEQADEAGDPRAGSASGVVGVWAASWLSPLQAVCQTHRVLLVTCCPGCGQVPWSTSAWTARASPSWTCPEHLPVARWRPGQPPAAAVASVRRVWCGHDLRTAGTEAATDRDLQVQQHLTDAAALAAVDPDGPVRVCGTPTTRLEFLHALLELTVEHRGSVAGLWRLGTDPRLLLDSLAAAVAVLIEPDPAAAVTVAHRRGLLRPTGRRTPIGPDSVLGRRPHNGLLAALRLGVADATGELSPAAQLTFRVGSGRPRYPEPGVLWADQPGSARGGQLPLRAVPQLLWPGLLTEHLTDAAAALTAVGGQDPTGALVVARACAAMFLARLGSTRPWRLIAIELGLPAWLADPAAALHRRLVERGRWPVFLADLDQLGAVLETHVPPVDYRVRRQLCADPQRLLAAVRAGRLLTGDLPSAAVPDELLARMFWQTYTGGDLRLAAPPVGWTDPATAAAGQHRLEDLDAAATPTLLATQAVLETYGHVLATGPLTWSPSAAGSAAPGGALSAVRSRPVEQDQDWSDGEHGIALSAALAAAEEDLTGHAFQPWLWRWLDVNYGICQSDENASWSRTVWALRTALTDPDSDPSVVRHPTLAAALRHTTRTSAGGVQRWQLLRHPAGRRPTGTTRPDPSTPLGVTAIRPAAG